MSIETDAALAQANERIKELEVREKRLKVGLIRAAAKFRDYETLHAAKPDMIKARANGSFAEMLEAILAGDEPSCVGCGSTQTEEELSAAGFVSCCPDRAMAYPADGGLRPQVRPLGETQSAFAVMRAEFERDRTTHPHPDRHLRVIDPHSLRDPPKDAFDALRDRVMQHLADVKVLLGIEHEARVLRRVAVEIGEERDAYKAACEAAGVCMSCVIRAPESFGCWDCQNTGWEGGAPAGFKPIEDPAVRKRLDELAERVRVFLAEGGAIDMAKANELADSLLAEERAGTWPTKRS